MQPKVKTRFAPSPTGYLHVGNARTALFSWLAARSAGGTFLLRIEDTDRARHVEGASEKVTDDLGWLGIDWDEGPDVGGANGPYVQSQRLDIYRRHVQRLLEGGHAYYAFETAEELAAMREGRTRTSMPPEGAAGAERNTPETTAAAKRGFRYPRPAEPVTDPAEGERARAAGRPVAVRFKCPGRAATVRDEVFGTVTVAPEQQEDFVILKDDGYPTFHLANVVDDHLMGVTLVMRGADFLGQTWRQALLGEALGFPKPRYAHLPLILDMQGRKLSKRDGAVEVHSFRAAGYLPEALVSFIALLGWSPAGGRERLSRRELIQAFRLDRLTKANARFDRAKLLAFNTTAAAEAPPERLLAGFKDYLSLSDTPIPDGDDDLLGRVLQANRGLRTFADVVPKSGVLFVADDAFEYDPKAVRKVLAAGGGAGYAVLAELRDRLAECDWSGPALHDLIEAVCQVRGVGMGKVAQPVRVAVTGTTISPGIVETLMLLGRAKTLARIDRCLAMRDLARPGDPA